MKNRIKIYQVELNPREEASVIWIKTDRKIVIPEDSCLFNLKEFEISKDSLGIDLIVEENLSWLK